MTNEEAIKILEKHHMWTGEPQEVVDVRVENKALDIAIKAIEQTELNSSYNGVKSELKPCEDCVSREETLNKINELIAEYIPLMPIGWTLPLNIAKTINELPPVTSQPKVGHWVEMELVDTGFSKFSCSVCKEGDFYNQIDNPFIPTKYCPNCGADMRGDADETNN